MSILINNKGFSMVGALVASALALVVTAGVSQMFVNMASQIDSLEKRQKNSLLIERIGFNLSSQACKSRLKDFATNIKDGTNPISFNQLKNPDDSVFLDISDQKSMESKYGMEGHLSFKLVCDEPSGCSCASETYPCSKQWRIDLISQRKTGGVLVYNRPSSYPINISYSSAPDPNQTFGNFSCSSRGQQIIIQTERPNNQELPKIIKAAECPHGYSRVLDDQSDGAHSYRRTHYCSKGPQIIKRGYRRWDGPETYSGFDKDGNFQSENYPELADDSFYEMYNHFTKAIKKNDPNENPHHYPEGVDQCPDGYKAGTYYRYDARLEYGTPEYEASKSSMGAYCLKDENRIKEIYDSLYDENERRR